VSSGPNAAILYLDAPRQAIGGVRGLEEQAHRNGIGEATPGMPRCASAASLPQRLRSPGPAGRALRWLLIAIVLLPIVMLLVGAWGTWRATWREAERDLRHTADAAAEFGLRTLSAYATAAGRVDAVLRGLSDAEITAREAELHAELKALVAELPQAEAAFVIDRNGRALVSANVFPVPREKPLVADRDFFHALQAPDAPAVHISRVSVGRLDGSLFFAVSRRRTRTGNHDLPDGAFDGLVNLSAYPNRLGEGLRRLVLREGDGLALFRSDGEILARSLGQSGPVRLAPGGPFFRAVAEGVDKATYVLVSQVDGIERLWAIRRIEGWPVYAQAGRSRADIIAAWRQAFLPQLAVGLPAALALLGLALAVSRSQFRLAEANAGLERRVAERTAALAASEAEFRTIFESAVIGMAQSDPTTGRLLRVNQRFCQMTGYTEAELRRRSFLDITHPEDRAGNAEGFFQAMRMGERYEVEKRYIRKDGTPFWVQVSVASVPAPDGLGTRTVAAVQDVTERRRGEEQRALLARELDHRAKNLLAVVQAALRLTPKDDAQAYARAVEGRVAALARAHTLLAQGGWEGAGLRALVESELSGFRGAESAQRVAIAGPAVAVSPAAAQAIAMALHELATNATKYGALSAPAGRVTLGWSIDRAAGALRLRWQERGGPPVPGEPERRGFGSRVIESTVRDQLGGRVERRWKPEGLVCDLTVPLARLGASAMVPAAA